MNMSMDKDFSNKRLDLRNPMRAINSFIEDGMLNLKRMLQGELCDKSGPLRNRRRLHGNHNSIRVHLVVRHDLPSLLPHFLRAEHPRTAD